MGFTYMGDVKTSIEIILPANKKEVKSNKSKSEDPKINLHD